MPSSRGNLTSGKIKIDSKFEFYCWHYILARISDIKLYENLRLKDNNGISEEFLSIRKGNDGRYLCFHLLKLIKTYLNLLTTISFHTDISQFLISLMF